MRLIKGKPYSSPEKVGRNSLLSSSQNAIWYEQDLKAQPFNEMAVENGHRLIFGDLISSSSENALPSWLAHTKGNFQVLQICGTSIQVASSSFGILPVFYRHTSNEIWVSDRIEHLISLGNTEVNVSKTHFLERLFFNYSLTNRTWVENIYMLPSNSMIQVDETGFQMIEYENIFENYTDQPKSLFKSRADLVDLFIQQVTDYLPYSHYASAFTGGFDGRCIVAAGLHQERDFTTFSFGQPGASDVEIPKAIAAKQKFSYQCIELNEAYLRHEFASQAESMVTESHGMATISRAHYRYGAQQLCEKHKFLLSGNFGSELFRSAHLDGVMTSNVFYNWLKAGLPPTLIEFKKLFSAFAFLNESELSLAYEELTSELSIVRQSLPDIPLNAQLYFLMWTNTIRNYFGPELSMQQHYIIHRSPFLDRHFFLALQETMFSGAYGEFRERNLIKRIKGQLFYSYYLKKQSPALDRAMTGKGYRPSDVRTYAGLGKIALSKLNKTKNPIDADPLLANEGFKRSNENWQNHSDFWNAYVSPNVGSDARSTKTLISGSMFLNHLKNITDA